MSALFQLANTCMNLMTSYPLMSSSGSGTESGGTGSTDAATLPDWVKQIVNAINSLLYPILILVGSAGLIYCIYLGVNLARADSADKQKEAKQRMINAIIGLVSIVALILLLKLFCSQLPNWIPNWQIDVGK